MFDFRTVVPPAGTAVFLLAPSRQGPDRNERRKKRKTRARGFEKKFATFLDRKRRRKWLRGD
jgi:hypothetical protein